MTTEGARRVLIEMILQAVEDVDAQEKYRSTWRNAESQHYRQTAIHFLKCPFFMQICDVLGIAGDQVKKKAFTKTIKKKRKLPSK
jgi:hypothetical protein